MRPKGSPAADFPARPRFSRSSAFSASSPLRSSHAIPSASDAICTPHRKLFTSFIFAPDPTGPRCTQSPCSSPPAPASPSPERSPPIRPPGTKAARPPPAPRLPVTGASSKSSPAPSQPPPSPRSTPGSPCCYPPAPRPSPPPPSSRRPILPSHTALEAASSASIETITLAPFAASAAVSATRAPCAANASAFARLRLYTASGNPAFSRFAAIPAPIVPKPSNATDCFAISSPSSGPMPRHTVPKRRTPPAPAHSS
jgi:hypothetical protein